MDNSAENIFNAIEQASVGAIDVEKIKWARYHTSAFRNMEIWLANNDGKALVLIVIPLPTPQTKEETQLYYVITEDMGNPVENTIFEILSAEQIKEFYGLTLRGDSKIHIANKLKDNLIGALDEMKKFPLLQEIKNDGEKLNQVNMAFTQLAVHVLDDKNLNNFNQDSFKSRNQN